MLNLLISLMTNTFSKIYANADREWKFRRASIWSQYLEDRNSIPVPFNVFPSVYSLKYLIYKLRKFIFNQDSLMSVSKKYALNEPDRRKKFEPLIERIFNSQMREEYFPRNDNKNEFLTKDDFETTIKNEIGTKLNKLSYHISRNHSLNTINDDEKTTRVGRRKRRISLN